MVHSVGTGKVFNELQGLLTGIQTFTHGCHSLINLLGRYLHRLLTFMMFIYETQQSRNYYVT